jgi:small-conductance mechanosensitive channel
LHTAVTIGYDAPWRTVHELLINAASSTDGIMKEPKPFVLQMELNDFYVTYQVHGYTKTPNKMALIYDALHRNIQDKFNEAGVEIMSPHYTALRDGNHIQIPDDYVTKDYKTPGFNINKEK